MDNAHKKRPNVGEFIDAIQPAEVEVISSLEDMKNFISTTGGGTLKTHCVDALAEFPTMQVTSTTTTCVSGPPDFMTLFLITSAAYIDSELLKGFPSSACQNSAYQMATAMYYLSHSDEERYSDVVGVILHLNEDHERVLMVREDDMDEMLCGSCTKLYGAHNTFIAFTDNGFASFKLEPPSMPNDGPNTRHSRSVH